MTTPIPYFFLLGGYDLEMVTIRELLEANGLQEGQDFLDKQLSWGAKLSDYQDDFHPERTNVAIELTEDIAPPTNYQLVDHHGANDRLPAAITQIADLLDISLNRHQQLVAANDSGYIPAMKAMNATEKEIQHIRKLDRSAQGVEELDEQLAVASIAKNRKVVKGVTVIKSQTDKFSTIADRLYGKTNDKLLIWTDEELTYYGNGKQRLEQHFQHYLAGNKMYAGGGEKGFIGVGKGKFSSQEIQLIKEQIINLL